MKNIDKIKDLEPGDHLGCLYRTEEEHRSLFTPFLRQGLEQHEKVVYIVDTHTAKAVLDYLRNDGVEVETYLESGQLSILTVQEAYMRNGIFDPDRMITLLKTEIERALAEGYSALRVTGEMSWALRGLPGSERLIEYEAKLNKFFPGSKCLAICQYDCGQFNSELILDVMATHPIVVFGTEAYDNLYYMSPKDFLGLDRDEAMLRNWIKNLVDRKQMEDALRESEERFRHIFEQSPLGICIESLDGKIVACNKTVEATTGYSFKELKKINLADLYENKKDKEALLKVIKQNGHVADYNVRQKRKDGTPYDALLSISRINLGSMDFLHTICQDITEQKQAEKEKERLKAQLIHSEKMAGIGTLASGIAHEFNNLLHIMRGHAEFAQSTKKAEDMEEALDIVLKTSDEVAKIIGDLLAFSREEISEKEKELCDITESIELVLSLIEEHLRKHNIEVVRKYERTPQIEMNKGEMQQVFLNIVTNARDAMLPKGGKLEIETKRVKENIKVSISDTGKGIKKENLGKLFEPFYTTKRTIGGDSEFQGTGLGLSVSYGIVKSHGGTIVVKSKMNKGTTFTVKLPLKKKEELR